MEGVLMSIYIPTCGRYEMLQKTVPRWLEQNILPVRLVVPAGQYAEHVHMRNAMGWDGVFVVGLPSDSWGIGSSRHFCVEHAARMGYGEIIMSDDDYRPSNGTDVSLLLEAAKDPLALGVGAARGLLDRFNSGALSRLSGVIFCPGGWGFMVYSLNIANTLECGNFDPELSFCEDAELMRNGIVRGLPWLLHCDVWMDSVGKRYEPGGISSLFDGDRSARDADESRCLRLVESRWPKYQHPMKDGVRSRMSWSKMYDDYMPGWRALSALHGGTLD